MTTIWKNFVTSGLPVTPFDSDYRKLYLTNTLLLTAFFLFSLFAAATCCVTHQYLIAGIDLTGALLSLLTIIYLRQTGRLFHASVMLVSLVGVLTLISIYFDTFPNMNLVWAFVIPLTALFLLERKWGTGVVLIYLAFYGMILFVRFDTLEMVNKGPILIANLFGALAAVTLLTRYFEISRKEAQDHLVISLEREAAQSQVLKDALAELGEYRKHLEERVDEGVRELHKKECLLQHKAKMASMGEMIAIIAHQLKQPLNIIALVTQDAKESYRMNDLDQRRIEELSQKTLKNVQFMSETIDGFKNFLDPNKTRAEYSLKESIKRALDLISPQLKSDEVDVDIRGEDIRLWGIESELQQVCINLVLNARDAIILNKAQNRTVEITLHDEGERVVLEVGDHAGGIPDTLLARLFDSFVTTKGEEGTGLGLYMVKMIIQSQNGAVSVTNREGGALFTIRLPKASPLL